MSRIHSIRRLIQYGLYYFTSHSLESLDEDGLTEIDAEEAILNGRIRRSWPKEHKYEITGMSSDGTPIGVVSRITATNKLRIITAYEDKKK